MRFILVASLIYALCSPLAGAGQVIYKNMYSEKNIVQGFGKTRDLALDDASSAKPAEYVLDVDNSWTMQMHNGNFMASRPIVKLNPAVSK